MKTKIELDAEEQLNQDRARIMGLEVQKAPLTAESLSLTGVWIGAHSVYNEKYSFDPFTIVGRTEFYDARLNYCLEAVASHARREALREVLTLLEHAGSYELTWKDAKNFITSELAKGTV